MTLWEINIQLRVCELEHGPVEIVDLPGHKMVIFHSYVAVYQRVTNNDDSNTIYYPNDMITRG